MLYINYATIKKWKKYTLKKFMIFFKFQNKCTQYLIFNYWPWITYMLVK